MGTSRPRRAESRTPAHALSSIRPTDSRRGRLDHSVGLQAAPRCSGATRRRHGHEAWLLELLAEALRPRQQLPALAGLLRGPGLYERDNDGSPSIGNRRGGGREPGPGGVPGEAELARGGISAPSSCGSSMPHASGSVGASTRMRERASTIRAFHECFSSVRGVTPAVSGQTRN